SSSGLVPEYSNTVDRLSPLPSTQRTATHHSLIFLAFGAARANTPSAIMRVAVSLCVICDLSSNATSSIESRGILPSSCPLNFANTNSLGVITHSTLAIWYQSRDRYDKLSVGERAELMGLVYEYYDGLPPSSKSIYTSSLSPYAGRVLSVAKAAGHTVVDGYNAIISILKKEKFEPTKWGTESGATEKADPMIRLQRFWSLAKAMGVENIWVLVDGIDEHPAVRTGKAIFQCVAEILLNQRLLEFREADKQVMCFKVFLTRPEELEPLLDEEKFRKDRIPVRKIGWKRKDLDIALKRRFAHYSNRSVLNFDDICEPKLAGTHDRLLDECGLNPRILFFMAYQILAAFQSVDQTATKLDKDSIDEGIALGKAAKM
ncbi:MAG: hypothetical protein WB994_09150, partial [Candidatus Acidiferrum sp.]